MSRRELTERRTEAGRHYLDPATGIVRFETVAGTPLNYDEGGEEMAAIDMRLQRVNSGALDGWRTTRNGYHFAIGQPGDKDSDGWIGFGQRGSWLLFRLDRAGLIHWPSRRMVATAATYDRANLSRTNESIDLNEGADRVFVQTSVTWSNVAPGVDLRWRANGRALKEEIEIAPARIQALIEAAQQSGDPLSDQYLFVAFEIEGRDVGRLVDDRGRPRRLAAGLDTAGPIQMRDQADQLLAFLPVDYAYLADPPAPTELAPASPRIALRRRFVRADGRDWLIVGAPMDQVAELAALNPASALVLDPSVEKSPTKDTYLDADQPFLTFPATNFRYPYTTSAGERKRRAFIEFNVNSIGASNVCISASLSVTIGSQNLRSDDRLDVYSLASGRDGWQEDELNYYKYKDGSNWDSDGANTAGVDYESTRIGRKNGPVATDAVATVNLDETRIGGWFGTSNTNYGLMIEGSSSVGSAYFSYYSNRYGDASKRPKLAIEYTPPIEPGAVALAGDGPSIVLGSVTVAPAAGVLALAGVAPTVLAASVPPIIISREGPIYILTAGDRVSVAILATSGAYWRLVDSGNSTEALGLTVGRYKAYLTPE